MPFMPRPGTGIGLGHNHASYFRIQARDRSGAGPGKLIEFPIAVIVFAGFFPEGGERSCEPGTAETLEDFYGSSKNSLKSSLEKPENSSSVSFAIRRKIYQENKATVNPS